MEKREIRLADGRHLIFYTFESPRCDVPPALPASSESEPEPRAPESQRGDHCTVNLGRSDAVESFRERVSREYARETGRAPLIFRVEAGDGAGEILG